MQHESSRVETNAFSSSIFSPIIDELAAMERILIELDITEALRPGELFGLRWKCFDPKRSNLRLQETVYKGKIRDWARPQRASVRFTCRLLLRSIS
jgi:integrase